MINKKSVSRFFAVQVMFTHSYNIDKNIDENIDDLLNFLKENYMADEIENYEEHVNLEFLENLIKGTINIMESIDMIIKKNLTVNFTFETIDDVIRAIFRLAVFELKYTDLEKKIIFNEYVDIAAEYLDDRAVAFVNATLDKMGE